MNLSGLAKTFEWASVNARWHAVQFISNPRKDAAELIKSTLHIVFMSSCPADDRSEELNCQNVFAPKLGLLHRVLST